MRRSLRFERLPQQPHDLRGSRVRFTDVDDGGTAAAPLTLMVASQMAPGCEALLTSRPPESTISIRYPCRSVKSEPLQQGGATLGNRVSCHFTHRYCLRSAGHVSCRTALLSRGAATAGYAMRWKSGGTAARAARARIWLSDDDKAAGETSRQDETLPPRLAVFLGMARPRARPVRQTRTDSTRA